MAIAAVDGAPGGDDLSQTRIKFPQNPSADPRDLRGGYRFVSFPLGFIHSFSPRLLTSHEPFHPPPPSSFSFPARSPLRRCTTLALAPWRPSQ